MNNDRQLQHLDNDALGDLRSSVYDLNDFFSHRDDLTAVGNMLDECHSAISTLDQYRMYVDDLSQDIYTVERAHDVLVSEFSLASTLDEIERTISQEYTARGDGGGDNTPTQNANRYTDDGFLRKDTPNDPGF